VTDFHRHLNHALKP